MKIKVGTLVLAATLVACGNGSTSTTGSASTGSSGGGGGASSSSTASGASSSASGTGGGTSATKACTDLATARCNRLSECSNGAAITLRYPDPATCLSRMELSCENNLHAPDGTVTPAFEEACAAAIPTLSCSDDLDSYFGAACTAPSGTRAKGAGCAFGNQCASGFCDIPKTAACGTCQPPPADGKACSAGPECGPNQYCSPASMCETYVPENGNCNADLICVSGLGCVGGGGTTTGVCKPEPATVGAPCDPTRKTGPDCYRGLGLYCDAQSSTCKAITYAAGGQPCGTINGAVSMCAAGGLCVITSGTAGTCAATAADGASCDAVNGPPCLGPARCVGGVCTVTDGTTCN